MNLFRIYEYAIIETKFHKYILKIYKSTCTKFSVFCLLVLLEIHACNNPFYFQTKGKLILE